MNFYEIKAKAKFILEEEVSLLVRADSLEDALENIEEKIQNQRDDLELAHWKVKQVRRLLPQIVEKKIYKCEPILTTEEVGPSDNRWVWRNAKTEIVMEG